MSKHAEWDWRLVYVFDEHYKWPSTRILAMGNGSGRVLKAGTRLIVPK